MATEAEITNLRNLLGEPIPAGGDEGDTIFSNARVGEIFDGANGSLEAAAYDGWREKAGLLSGLVDVTEGAASRALSKLYDNAMDMVKLYQNARGGPTEGRARVGRIVRPDS